MSRTAEATARRRRRTRTLLVVTTLTTLLMTGATLLVFPISWRRAPSPSLATSAPLAPRPVPRVTVARGSVRLDDHEIARTEALEQSQRVQRIDALYDALRARHYDDANAGSQPGTVDVEIAADVPAVVAKSTLQTLAFAGYADVRFAATDGGSTHAD